MIRIGDGNFIQIAFQCLRGMYIVHSVNTRYVLIPKCEVLYGTHKKSCI